MRKPGGYTFLTGADGKTTEGETFTCRHCSALVMVGVKERPEDVGGLCKACMGLVCARCVGNPCDVIEKKLAKAEASYHARRSYGL